MYELSAFFFAGWFIVRTTTGPSRSMVQCLVLISSCSRVTAGRVEHVPGGRPTPRIRTIRAGGGIAMLYEAPVLRRLSLQVGVSAVVAFLVAALVGAIE